MLQFDLKYKRLLWVSHFYFNSIKVVFIYFNFKIQNHKTSLILNCKINKMTKHYSHLIYHDHFIKNTPSAEQIKI